jgi:hypothetical protein
LPIPTIVTPTATVPNALGGSSAPSARTITYQAACTPACPKSYHFISGATLRGAGAFQVGSGGARKW